jgi:hypothetical protein
LSDFCNMSKTKPTGDPAGEGNHLTLRSPTTEVDGWFALIKSGAVSECP